MAEAVALPVARRRLQDAGVGQRHDDRTELVHRRIEDLGEQVEVEAIAERGGGRDDVGGPGDGVEPGDQRLVQHLGDAGRAGRRHPGQQVITPFVRAGSGHAGPHQLFDVQGNAGAACQQVGAVGRGHAVGIELVDQRLAVAVIEGGELDRRHPHPGHLLRTARDEDAQRLAPLGDDGGDDGQAGLVVPVHVLGDEQGVVARHDGQQVAGHRCDELVLQLATISGRFHVSRRRRDLQHRGEGGQQRFVDVLVGEVSTQQL